MQHVPRPVKVDAACAGSGMPGGEGREDMWAQSGLQGQPHAIHLAHGLAPYPIIQPLDTDELDIPDIQG